MIMLFVEDAQRAGFRFSPEQKAVSRSFEGRQFGLSIRFGLNEMGAINPTLKVLIQFVLSLPPL